MKGRMKDRKIDKMKDRIKDRKIYYEFVKKVNK